MAGRYLLEITQQRHLGAPDSVVTPFLEWGELELDTDRLRRDPGSIRAVFFSGGTDVSPALYGESRGRHTDEPDVGRDSEEQELYRLARAAGLPLVGICRGSQFLCIMAGGRLGQHIDGHGLGRHETHPMRALDEHGASFLLDCSSTHHQIQLPPDDAEILAWAEPVLTGGVYLDGSDRPHPLAMDYEAVFHPSIRAIGLQWHPEWMAPDHPCVEYSRRIAAAKLRV